jgi:hypothetical protein
MPANTMGTNGDHLTVLAWGSSFGAVGNYQVFLDVGGLTVLSHTSLPNSSQWHLSYDFVRRTSASQATQGRYTSGLSLSSAPVVTDLIVGPPNTYDLTSSLLFEIRAAAAAGGTIRCECLVVSLAKAP